MNTFDLFTRDDKFLKLLKLDVDKFEEAIDKVPEKVEESKVRLLNAMVNGIVAGGNLQYTYVGHSGGKDSVLVRYLADEAYGFDRIPTIHTTKPSDVENSVHPLTKDFLYRQTRPITYVGLDQQHTLNFKTQIDGTRIAEHDRDDGRSVDVVVEGKSVSRKELKLYMENGLFGLNFIYPIYDWSNEEVWAAIYALQISFSEEYLVGL